MNYLKEMQSLNDMFFDKDQENVVYPLPHVFNYKLNGAAVIVSCRIIDSEVTVTSIEYKGINVLSIVDEEELYHIKLKAKETL